MASIHIHICKGLKTQELHVRPGGKEGLRFMLANSRMSKPTAAELKREQKFREEQAELALNCPCLDKLRAGPCGKEFSRAFLCFLKSGHPEKGSDCISPQFEDLQDCVERNYDAILQARPPDDPSRHRKEPDLPPIPADKIRLPPWLKKKREDEQIERESKEKKSPK